MTKLSLALLVCGACLLVGGFIYDARFAGIPYQDPTSETRAQYDRDAGMASKTMQAGLAAMGAGVLGFAVFGFGSKKKADQDRPRTTRGI